jgi:hypothetical protein
VIIINTIFKKTADTKNCRTRRMAYGENNGNKINTIK